MNGMAIVERNDVGTKAIYFDQEVVEFARQNAKAKKNRAEAEKKQKEADAKRRKAKKAEAQRKAYNVATAKYLLTRFAVSGVMVAGYLAGLIHPIVAAPIFTVCLCTASERLGQWRARNRKKKEDT